MGAYQVLHSVDRELAISQASGGRVVVYNLGPAKRDVDEEAHGLPVGHYGILECTNPVVEDHIKNGLLELVNEGGLEALKSRPKAKPASKKSTAAKASPPTKDDDEGESAQDDDEQSGNL